MLALGRIATIYHIPFAVANRASFGVWGSFWPVLNRAAMAVIWFGVQVCIPMQFEEHQLTLDSRTSGVSLYRCRCFELYVNINR